MLLITFSEGFCQCNPQFSYCDFYKVWIAFYIVGKGITEFEHIN